MPVSWRSQSNNFLNPKRETSNAHDKYLHSGVLQIKCFEKGHVFTYVWQTIRDKQNVFETFWVEARTVYKEREKSFIYGLNKQTDKIIK